ncbi:MAG: hypothetical protein ACTSSF_06485 [Candidatus Heimdallarchaeaceae archaeon]
MDVLFILGLVFVSLLIIWYCFSLIGIPKVVQKNKSSQSYGFFLFLFILLIALVGFALNRPFGDWLLFFSLLIWAYIQYKKHWYWVTNEPNQATFQKYKEEYGNNLFLFPLKEERIIPDFYHITLHLLALGNFVIVAIRLVKLMTTIY